MTGIKEEADISLFLTPSFISHENFKLIIYPLWNPLNKSTVSYYDFFYYASSHVCVNIRKEDMNKNIKIDVTDLFFNNKGYDVSQLGLLLCSDAPGIARFYGINSKNPCVQPYLEIHNKVSCFKKSKIKIYNESIFPSEECSHSKPVKTDLKSRVSFYVKNTNKIESITVQMQASPDGERFYNEGVPIQIPPLQKKTFESNVISKKVRLSVYGSLVFSPAKITSILYPKV